MRTSAYLVLLLLACPLQLSGQDRMARAERAWVEGDVDTAFRLYSQELQADSTNVTALHRIALVEAWNERYERSLTLLDKALRLAPDYTPAAIESARVLAWSQRFDEARSAIGDVLSREPNNLEALELRGQIAAWTGSHQEALEVFERLSREAPDPARFVLPLAKALAATGEPAEALRLITPVVREHPDSVELLEARGEFAYLTEQYADALESYERALSLAPGLDRLHLGRSRALAAMGRDDEAWRALEGALRDDPDDMEALSERARIAVATERWSEALETYTRLASMAADPAPYRLARVRVLSSMGRYEEAIDSLDAIPAGAADESDVLRLRGELAMGAGDLEAALDAYDRLLEIDPNDPTILEAKARVASWTEAWAESIDAYDRLLRVAEDPEPFRLQRARVLAWEGRLDDALEAVDEILEDDPTNIEALEAKAQFASWAGRYEESLVAYDVLEETGRYDARHELPRARVLAFDRQYQSAIAAYESILAGDPDDREALMGLGQVLAWTARYDSANAVYDRVLEADPGAADALSGKALVANWSADLLRGEQLWEQLRAIDPESPDYLVGMASNMRLQGRHGEAEDLLTGADQRYPDHAGIRDQLALIDVALAPQISPFFSFVSDSDENEVTTFGVTASVQLGGPFELQIGGNRKDLQQTNRPELDRQTLDGQVSLGARIGSGWTVTGGVGVWQPEGDDADASMTGSLALASPAWRPTRGALTYQRSTYDVTALAIQDPVEVDEVQLTVGSRIGDRTTWAANVSGARFDGSETNTRLLGGTRLTYSIASWLAAGPSVRAFSFEKDLDDGYWDPDSYAVLELPFTVGPAEGNFRPTLEIAPGYQRIEPSVDDDPWSFAFRVQAGLAYALGPRRQIGVTGVFANSGIQQFSDATDADYEYRGVRAFLAWAF